MTDKDNSFDALAPETFDSPYRSYAELLSRCPVAHSPSWGGFWALLSYDEVTRAAADYRTFITSRQNVIPKVAFTGRRPPLHFDPPDHTPYRQALNPLLREERTADLEPVIRGSARRHIAEMVARGEGDLCADMSSHLPIDTFAAWMNIDGRQAEALTEAGRAYNIAVQGAEEELVKTTSLKLYGMATDLIRRRREAPMDPDRDFTSALLAARVGGEPLPEEMIVGTIRQVLVVGIIAPTVIIGSIGVHLARDQALQRRLRAEPALIPAATEEFLRLYTPYRGFARTAVAEVEIAGCPIPADEPIALIYASANRDPARFPDPHSFVLDRPNIAEHVAFGRGPHHCPGAALGRMEIRVAIEELLAGTAHFELSAEPKQTRFPEIGALSVPLRLTQA